MLNQPTSTRCNNEGAPAAPSRACVLLREHISGRGETHQLWAGRLGISRAFLTQILNSQKRPGLDLAIRIDRETSGAVPVVSWGDAAPSSERAA